MNSDRTGMQISERAADLDQIGVFSWEGHASLWEIREFIVMVFQAPGSDASGRSALTSK